MLHLQWLDNHIRSLTTKGMDEKSLNQDGTSLESLVYPAF